MNEILEEARAALWTVWNRRWLALAVAWGVCLLGWLAVALIPNSYESNARLFVQFDDVLADQIGIGTGSRQKDIERVRQTLTSAVNLEKVIRSTRLGETISSPADMERAVQDLAKEILIKGDEDNLFQITATSGRRDLSDAENAQLAQDVAQHMIDIFREENLGGSRGEMRETIDFLDQQLADREKQLEDAEQKRLAFEAEHPDLAGGPQSIATQLASSRAELRSVEADLAAAQSALAALQGQLASTPRTLVTAGSGGPRAALAQAQANLASLKARGLTDSHPDVEAAKKQIAALSDQAATAGDVGGTPNPAYGSLQSMLVERRSTVQALQSRAAALGSEIASISASQAQEPGVSAEAQRISRDYDVLRKQYDKLLQDREELRLRGQVETEHNAVKFEVVDPPSTPRVPASPNRPLLLLAVLVLGLGAGAGSAFALGQLNSTFATANKLERVMDLPVVGTISLTLTDAARALRRRRLRMFLAGAGGLGLLFVVLLGAEFVQRGMVA
ncbi:chain-length determining protein [Altererythrobacter sp. B11]|uniref:XrtA system polysaccharide chain length determinant n=1 Tax=Altererythrobacter sp. B11 TaxID=2060312 RepID=UPI000DC6DD10|nr:XrtA system polysaccharide chain length determinant [Altererythrobacter sp. B11]BBC72972.1 chain-length determining protein [Altererythrobacter sp. B11]